MSRGVALAAVAVALAVGACSEQSRVDRNAEVRIEGRALEPGGGALAGRPVHMGSDVTGGEVLTAVLTLGLSCVDRGCGGTPFDTTTAEDGTFGITLKGGQTQSSFGEARTQLVSTSAAPSGQQVSGAAVSARFRVQTTHVRLPTLQLVDPGLDTRVEQDLLARWSTETAGPYELTVESDEIVPVWRVTSAAGEASIDRRVLELDAGRIVVSGKTADAVEGSDVELRWRSPGIGIHGVGQAPPSRGRPCRYLVPSGRVVDHGACGLTDGRLGVPATTPSGCVASDPSSTTASTQCERPTAVDISLSGTVPAELIVVRGCEQPCAVAVSADGTTFREVGDAATEFATVPLDGSAITAVRVGLPAGPTSELREVSVWAARPDLRGQPRLDALRDLFSGRSESSNRRGLLAVAAALLALVLVATGFVIGRRQAAPTG